MTICVAKHACLVHMFDVEGMSLMCTHVVDVHVFGEVRVCFAVGCVEDR